MHASRISWILAVLALAPLTLSLAMGPQPVPKRKAGKPLAKIGYASVAPIFKSNCLMCHSGPKPKHFLNLSSYASIMKGDREGKVVIASKPGDSRLSKAIHRKGGAASMPPMKALPAADVAKIDAWIKAGAKP